MTPYKTVLKLNQRLNNEKDPAMTEGFPVSECDYELGKETLPGGEITSSLKSGIIRLVIPQLPSSTVLAWMFQSHRQMNGTLVTYNLHQEVVEKISFTQARPIQLRFHYGSNGVSNATTLLTIMAQTLIIGDHELQNHLN